jgi:hypothetical protein
MPGATLKVMYSRELRIVEPSSKFIVFGATAAAITTLMLLAALYAPLDCLCSRGNLHVSSCRADSLGPAAATCSRSTAPRPRWSCFRSCSARP